jgi:hypothetical protein
MQAEHDNLVGRGSGIEGYRSQREIPFRWYIGRKSNCCRAEGRAGRGLAAFRSCERPELLAISRCDPS